MAEAWYIRGSGGGTLNGFLSRIVAHMVPLLRVYPVNHPLTGVEHEHVVEEVPGAHVLLNSVPPPYKYSLCLYFENVAPNLAAGVSLSV